MAHDFGNGPFGAALSPGRVRCAVGHDGQLTARTARERETLDEAHCWNSVLRQSHEQGIGSWGEMGGESQADRLAEIDGQIGR